MFFIITNRLSFPNFFRLKLRTNFNNRLCPMQLNQFIGSRGRSLQVFITSLILLVAKYRTLNISHMVEIIARDSRFRSLP